MPVDPEHRVKPRQVQLADRVEDRPHQMVLRDPVAHRRRHQKHLVTVNPDEPRTHTRRIPPRPDDTPLFPTASVHCDSAIRWPCAALASSRQRRRASSLRSRAHVVPMHRMQRLRPSGASAGFRAVVASPSTETPARARERESTQGCSWSSRRRWRPSCCPGRCRSTRSPCSINAPRRSRRWPGGTSSTARRCTPPRHGTARGSAQRRGHAFRDVRGVERLGRRSRNLAIARPARPSSKGCG